MPRRDTKSVMPSDAAVDDGASVDGGGKKSLEQVGAGDIATRTRYTGGLPRPRSDRGDWTLGSILHIIRIIL